MPPDIVRPAILRQQSAYPDSPFRSHPGVAVLFAAAGLDAANPFGPWIQPGMRVLIKPNWVRHAAEGWSSIDALVTHPTIINPVVEAVAAALRNRRGEVEGKIILGDAPLQSASFEMLLEQCQIPQWVERWNAQAIPVEVRDFRRVVASTDDSTGIVQGTKLNPGASGGFEVVNLGSRSRLEELSLRNAHFGVSNYDSETTSHCHRIGQHSYCLANPLLEADVIVNLPKWKTHVKTGITGALKNFIGVNCDKAYLPHFRPGSPRRGGDEFPDTLAGLHLNQIRPLLERVLPAGLIRNVRKTFFNPRNRLQAGQFIFGGAWPGNDTLWRTIHDINFIARWCAPGGVLRTTPRPILTLLDAITAGEGDGPLRPQPAPFGCLLFGTDPGYIDATAAALSGFDWRSIPMLLHLVDKEAALLTEFSANSELPAPERVLLPPTAWTNQILLDANSYAAA